MHGSPRVLPAASGGQPFILNEALVECRAGCMNARHEVSGLFRSNLSREERVRVKIERMALWLGPKAWGFQTLHPHKRDLGVKTALIVKSKHTGQVEDWNYSSFHELPVQERKTEAILLHRSLAVSPWK